VKVLKDDDLSESNSKVISDGRLSHAEELNTNNISESFVRYEERFI
jgi:hypothetical protein